MHKRSAVLGGAVLLLALIGCQGGRSEATGQQAQSVAIGGGTSDPLTAAKQAPVTTWTAADDAIISPIWLGNDDNGTLYAPLWRGAFPGIEDWVYTPDDNDCSKTKVTLRIDWDRSANTVNVLVKGRGMPVRPSVNRVSGVDYFPNDPFHDDPQNFDNGAYRFWIIVPSSVYRVASFYYDATTLLLKGSELDFPSGQPANTIPVQFPILPIMDSFEFDPDATGFAVHQWNATYNHMTTEGGKFAYIWTTFVPLDLCEAAPFQPGISQLRPYLSPWQSPDLALSWDKMLDTGLGFDLQVDPRTDRNDALGGHDPYGFSGISFAGNLPAEQGGIPNNHGFSILTAFQNVAPTLLDVPGGNGKSCQRYVHEPHVSAPRYCEQAH